MSNKPEWIIVHHTAVSYDKNPDQFEATNNYHKSLGWGMIGYHYEIAKNGKLYKGRGETMVGAHTKQQMMNYKSIGICLDGNFDIELPTKEQEEALKGLIKQLQSKYGIPDSRIVPHRYFAGYKSCYGKLLADDWAQKLIQDSKPKYIFKLVKEKGNRDIYAVHNGIKHKICNEYTFSMGQVASFWGSGIEDVDDLSVYEDGIEVVFSPMDN